MNENNIIGLVFSSIAIIISIIVFVNQHKQNYRQNVFQMMNTYHNFYDKTYKKVTQHSPNNVVLSTYEVYGNQVVIHVLRDFQIGGNSTEFKDGTTNDEKFARMFWNAQMIFGSRLDNLVNQILFIDSYMKKGFFIKLLNWIFNTNSFKEGNFNNDYLPVNLINEYEMMKKYFNTTIYQEFKLLVLLFYINDRKEAYEKFLSIKHFRALRNVDFSLFLNSNTDYDIFLKEKVLAAVEELNKL